MNDISRRPLIVAENDTALLRLICRRLGRGGRTVTGVPTGVELIELACARPDALLVLDYVLADLTAEQVVHALLERGCQAPFVVITGRGDEKTAVTMMKLGARDYLIKEPGLPDRLDEVIRRVERDLAVEDELRVHARDMAALNRLGRLVAAHLAVDEVIRITGDQLLASLNPDLVMLFTRDGEELHLSYSAPADSRFRHERTPVHRVGECVCGLAARNAEPVYAADITADPRCTWAECRKAGIRSLAAIPLVAGDSVLGVAVIASGTERDFAPRSAFIEAQVAHAAIALANARLYEQVSRSEERYRLLFEDSPAPLWVEDFSAARRYVDHLRAGGVKDIGEHFRAHPDQVRECVSLIRLLDVNRAALALHGAARKEQLLESLHAVFVEESYEPFIEELVAADDGRSAVEIELKTRTLAGEPREVLIRWSAAPGFERTLERVYVSVVDLTEMRRAERRVQASELRYRELIQGSRDGYVRTDLAGRFLECSDGYLAMLGYSQEELLRLGYRDITPERWHEWEQVNIVEGQILARGYSDVYEIEYIHKGGAVFPVEIRSYLVRDDTGKPVGMWGLARDITARHRAEMELAHHRERLEELVAERTRELRAAQDELVRNERLAALGRVAGSIAHEIRNPLGSIRNAVFYLKMNYQDRLKGRPARHLDIVEEEIERANRVIISMLEFARGRPPAPSPHRLDNILADALREAALPDTVHIVTAIPTDLPPLNVDRFQLTRVLVNILVNARQAVDERGEVRITARPLNGMVEITASDNGPGVKPEHMGRLFEPLFSTKAVGIGLGLAICKGYVEAHGGTIRVESPPGRGAAIIFTVPLARPV